MFAAPLTFSAAGEVASIDDGWFVNIFQATQFSSSLDRTATFTASQPLSSIQFYADNLPFSVGSGWIFYLDGVEVLNTGIGVLVQQTITLAALQPFTTIRVETNYAPGLVERGNLTHFLGTPVATPTPEPSTFALMIVALVLVAFAILLWSVNKISAKLLPFLIRKDKDQP